jgi:DUF438 domain-containing protein
MSELINNSTERKKRLKELILKLHTGESQESVRHQLLESLSQIPYGEVVEVEQELISEVLPEEEVLNYVMHIQLYWGNRFILIENSRVTLLMSLSMKS